MSYQIFISYRREGGDVTAKLICEALKNNGYTVFYDYDSISGGFFDERILKSIEDCNDFILVLPPNSLDRCANNDDWVRAEISCALSNKKNIIPVMLPNFKFPKDLPEDIADISRINAVHFFMAYFEEVIETIKDRLISKPTKIIPPHENKEPSKDLKFTFQENLNGYGVAIGKCTDTEIRIPDTYNGKAVVAIEEDGFRDCSAIKAAFLPETIKCIEEHAFHGCTLLESINIPSNVTDIEGWAFYECSSIKNIVIPKNVKNIGTRAFTDCTSLLSFKVDEDNKYYCDLDEHLYTKNMCTLVAYACGKAEEAFVVPEGVTKIEDSAFSTCSSLSSITLPNSVTCIEKFAFVDCINLETISLPDCAESIGSAAFKRCSSLINVTIPQGIQTISDETFRDCTSLNSVIIPETIKSIGESAFSGCTLLESINIPSNVTDIKGWAFYECSSIKNIVIPKNVKNIGMRAFTDCTSLLSFKVDKDNKYYCDLDEHLYTKNMCTLVAYACGKAEKAFAVPEGITNIEDCAFSSASSLSNIILPNSVIHIGKFAFVDCVNLETISLPDCAESIGSSAFKRCSSLINVTIPKKIQTISENVFRDCTLLKAVILPKTIKSIEESAFNGCTSLKDINIPGNVTNIDKWAFYKCSSLRSIQIPKKVKSIGTRAFAGCTSLEKIAVSAFNRFYRSAKKALFTKDMKTLFAYALGDKESSYTIPQGVTHIADSAFSHSDLEHITISNGITDIGEFSFYKCSKLKTLKFDGTVEMFKEINVKENSFNKSKTKEVRCSDGNVKV